MSFSAEFQAAMEDERLYPLYLIESIIVDGHQPYGGTLRLSSFHTHETASYAEVIDPERSSISYGDLRPGSWSATGTAWSIGIARSSPMTFQATRGTPVQLRSGCPGWPLDLFEVVAIGVVQGFSRSGNRWSMQIIGMESALWSRFADGDTDHRLFGDLSSTTLTSGYTPGDTTVNVASSTGFERQNGSSYLIKITPTSGSAIYLLATGRTGTSFTGCTDPPDGFGTSTTAAVSGDKVEEMVFIEEHPIEVLRRMLLSTGTTGQHGSADTLPATWAFGFPPGMVDEADMTWQIDRSEPDTGTRHRQMVTGVLEDAAGFIGAYLAPGGFFLTQRQGRLTARVVLDFDGTAPRQIFIATDDDIAEITSQSAYSQDLPVQYRRLKVSTAGAPGSFAGKPGNLGSRPTREDYEITLSDVWLNDSEIRSEVRDRLGKWYIRVPESVSVTLAGWRSARLAMGDGIVIDSEHLQGRQGAIAPSENGVPAMIVGGGVDWFGSSATWDVLYLPTYSTEG